MFMSMRQANEVLAHAQSELVKCGLDKKVRLFVRKQAPDIFEDTNVDADEVRVVNYLVRL